MSAKPKADSGKIVVVKVCYDESDEDKNITDNIII
jgi:hypothetical protein